MANATSEVLGAALLIFVVSTTVFSKRPPPSLGKSDPVPSEVDLHLLAPTDRGDGVLAVTSLNGDTSVTIGRRWVYQDDEQRKSSEAAGIKFKYARHRYFIDPGLDFGTYAGIWKGQNEEVEPFQMGLRLSPIRLCYGAMSADIMVGNETAGFGLSFYTPPDVLPWAWLDHVGLQYGCLYPYKGGGSASFVGISFSILP